MGVGTQSRLDDVEESSPDGRPEIRVCTSDPETQVFLESGNSDGWISTDLTADVTQ